MRHLQLACVVCVLALVGAESASAAPHRSWTHRWEALRGAATRDLAERQFPGLIGRATGAPAPMPNGLRIDTPLSETVAQVETATGKPGGVAAFTQPVATKVGGKLELVDLDLVRTGNGLEARNAAVDIRYPQVAGEPVRLTGTGVAFTADAAAAVPTLADGNELFFPDALPGDTDYALVPKADGVEALWQLRSEESPETLRLSFDVPAGAVLRPVSGIPGAAEVAGADGVLAAIKPPAAVDAHGTTVDVEASVDGDDIVYSVRHRDRAVAYPILVDPTVAENWSKSVAGQIGGGMQNCGADGGMHSSGAGAWTYGQSIPSGSTAFLPACDMRQFGWGYGLYVLQYANSPYVNGAMGLWMWAAPTDAYISGVNWLGLGHRPGNLATGNTTMFAGIGNVFTGWNAYTEINAQFHMDWYQPTGANHSSSQAAMTGLRVNGNGSRSIGAYSQLEGAVVYLNDDYSPTVTLTGHVPGNTGPALNEGPWFDPDVTVPKYRLSLADRGLGVWNWAIVRNDTGGVLAGNTPLPCFGTKVWHCPNSYDTGTLNYNASALPEGVAAVHAVGWDANEHTGSSPTWKLRVDRTAPTISLSGAAYAQRDELTDPSALLHVVATDGSTASTAAQRSGIKTLNVYADGTLLSNTGTLSCPGGSCQAVLDVGMQSLSAGDHTISITATDQVGHSRSTSFTLSSYPMSAYYGGADHTVDTDAEAATVGSVLASSQLYQAVWNGLTPTNRNYMLEAEDPSFASWASRIDTAAPDPVDDIGMIGGTDADRTAEIGWGEGGDPDIGPVPGTQVDEDHSEYRFRRGDGDYSAWRTTDEMGFTLSSVDSGDVVTVQVREYDRAGNPSPIAGETLTVPEPEAQAAFVIVAIGCVAYCPAAVTAAAAGATVASVWVIHNVHWPAIHLPHFSLVKVIRTEERSESFEDWKDRQERERRQLRGNLDEAGELQPGEEAHHIVAVRHRYAEYARKVMWKCNIDLKDLDNGVGMQRRYHRRVHTKAYFAAIDRMLTPFDPDKQGSCLNDPDDAFGPGIRGALRKIAQWIEDGRFNG